MVTADRAMRGLRYAIVPIVYAAYGQFYALLIDVAQHAIGAFIVIDAAPVVSAICEQQMETTLR